MAPRMSTLDVNAIPFANGEYNLKLFLLQACVELTRREAGQPAECQSAGQLHGAPVVGGASPLVQPAGVPDMAPAGPPVAGGGLASVSMTLTVNQISSQKAGSHAGLI